MSWPAEHVSVCYIQVAELGTSDNCGDNLTPIKVQTIVAFKTKARYCVNTPFSLRGAKIFVVGVSQKLLFVVALSPVATTKNCRTPSSV